MLGFKNVILYSLVIATKIIVAEMVIDEVGSRLLEYAEKYDCRKHI